MVFMLMSDNYVVDYGEYLVPDGSLVTYLPSENAIKGNPNYGVTKQRVNEYKDEVFPQKVMPLVNFARGVWEDKVNLMRKINPDWKGYHGYFA